MGAWQISINLAGVKPLDPTKFQEVTEGAYEVQIIETDRYEKDGKVSIKVVVKHVEAQHIGAQHHVYVGTDTSKEYNKAHWRALLEGVLLARGASTEVLEKGENTLAQTSLDGRNCYVYVKPAPIDAQVDEKGRKPLPDVRFITKALYAEMKQNRARATDNGAAPAGLGGLAAGLGGTAAGSSKPAALPSLPSIPSI